MSTRPISWAKARRRLHLCADRGFSGLNSDPPAGNVKRDWEIISLLASELGYPMHYENNQQIWDEMRELCPLFYGVTSEKMGDMNMSMAARPSIIPARGCIKTTADTPSRAVVRHRPARAGGAPG